MGKRYTNSGELHDLKGLKHRPDDEVRLVPIPPELVRMLRWHIAEFGVAPDGRLFGNRMAGSLTHRRTARYGAPPGRLPSLLPRSNLRSRGVPTTCGTRRSRYGSTLVCPLPRWPGARVIRWMSCSGYTPTASTVMRRLPMSASAAAWARTPAPRAASPLVWLRLFRLTWETWRVSSRVYPANSGSRRLPLAYGCTSPNRSARDRWAVSAGQAASRLIGRRVWDSNPR